MIEENKVQHIFIEPPKMSRQLWDELIEYRKINVIRKCWTCNRDIPTTCPECGQPMHVDYIQFCKVHNEPLITLYIYEHKVKHKVSPCEVTHHPILGCPICGIMDWWSDEGPFYMIKENYLTAVQRFHTEMKTGK